MSEQTRANIKYLWIGFYTGWLGGFASGAGGVVVAFLVARS